MLKLINKLVFFGYNKPRVLNIASLLKKQGDSANQTSKIFLKNGRTITNQMKNEDMEYHNEKNKANFNKKQFHNEEISIKQIQKAINAKDDGMDKAQLQINYQIKIEVKESNLYQLYRLKYLSFTPKNLTNLLIKLLELRYINQAFSQQSAQFDKFLLSITKKINKLSPQDMIRFLFSFKKVEMNNFDLKKMHTFIGLILDQFTTRSVIKGYQSERQYQAFEVISMQSSLKLLHSLVHLHFISGSQFEPTIVELIKKSLNYFHIIVRNYLTKKEWQGMGRKIKWHFYFSFVSLSVKYQMPLQMIADFLKALYPFKMSFMNKHELLVDVSESLNELQRIRRGRGENINEIKQLFYVYQIIYENLEKPQQILKMKPISILRHMKNLSYFSEEEINLLGFKQMKQKSLLKILQFSVKTYQKYYCKDYQTQLQKSSFETWIKEANNSYRQYLGQLILEFHGYLLEGSFTNISEFNKLINFCLQWYSELSFNAKTRKFTNTKIIADIYFNRQNAIIKQTKQFKKHQELESYIRLFGYWPQIKEISKHSFNLYLEGTFIKLFYNAIIHIPHLQVIAKRFACRISIDKDFYDLMLKKFFKFSTENRSLSKNFIGLVQEVAFKRELKQLNRILKNEKEDADRLSRYVRVKYRLRQKLKRSLTIFKFYILVFQELNQKEENKIDNITLLPDFNRIYTQFNDELMCLNFIELFTLQIFALASEISIYLSKKMNNSQQCRVYDICKRKNELKVQIIVPIGTGCLKFIDMKSEIDIKQ